MEGCGEVVNCCVMAPNMKNLERISLPCIKLTDTVHNLKLEVAKKLDAFVGNFAVVFHGKSLNEEDTLESSGIKYGMTLHLMPKPQACKLVDSPAVERSDVALEHLALTLKASMRSSTFRNAFHMFTKQNIFENIIAAAPGLADDPVAIACILDADLLAQFTDVATLKRAVESHPSLVEAISHIVANILDPSNQPGPSGLNNSSLPLTYSYLLEPSDDDDDVDSSSQADLASSSGTSQTPNMENAAVGPFAAITPAQLASALAAVVTSPPLAPTTAFGPLGSSSPLASSNQPTNSTAGTSSAGSIISSELFSQAIQQAISVSTQSQIQQLRDMGITDDGLSLRALQLTGGDVQNALELIFAMQQNDGQNS
ncbi:Ubiquitin-like protein 7 [Chamberlinius hualienensis]